MKVFIVVEYDKQDKCRIHRVYSTRALANKSVRKCTKFSMLVHPDLRHTFHVVTKTLKCKRLKHDRMSKV